MITVDTREHLSPIIKDLLVTSVIGENVPEFKFECLPLGDYLLQNGSHSMLIERKSISDFCGSHRELKPRLARMRKLDYQRIGLLLEGTYHVANGQVWLMEGNTTKPRMSYQVMANFLTHQEELGIRLYHTMTLEETLWRLIHIHNYLPKLDEPTPSIKAGSPAEWIAELPGVGKKTLAELKSKFASPYEALSDLPERAKTILSKW